MWALPDKSGRKKPSHEISKDGGHDQIVQGITDLELAKQQGVDSRHPGGHRHSHRRRSQVQQVESKEESKTGIPHASRSSRARSFGAAITSFLVERDFPKDLECDITNLRKFHTKCRSVVCHKCQAPLGANVGVSRHIREWSCGTSSTGSMKSVCSAACSFCFALTCLGCGREPRIGANVKRTEHGVLDWCCSQGRLFAIWLFAARYDEIHIQMETMTAHKSHHLKVDHSDRDSKVTAKGVGYAKDDLSWLSTPMVPVYDDIWGLRSGATATKAINFKQADSMTDKVLERILFFVCELLPNSTGESTFDQDPPPTLCAIFQLGLLLDKLAELLRNDSINDLCARASLYFAVLELVRRLASHCKTSGLVTARRYSKKYTKGLRVIAGAEEAASRSGFNQAKGADRDPLSISGASSSLASLFQGLVKQSIIILSAPDEFGGRSGQETLDLCTEVSLLNATIMSLTPGDEAKGKGKGKGKGKADAQLGSDTVADKWAVWHREHGLERTDKIPGEYFYYLKELSRLRRSPKGRIPRLIKEIAEMSTGLPQGIFVRASMERPDAMKCLIVGPDDTPYAGGLFEFDIFATEYYPKEPPRFHFLTTAGGAVCMNPNLYENGHVCLSLLGTWDGPPESKWQSHKSTILQVLLSIQSMILVSDPWRNEPINQSDTSKDALQRSREYSDERQVYTILYAMIPWLERRYAGNMWNEVVDVYFQCHAKKIVKTVREWARRNRELRRYWVDPYSTIDVVAKLEKALTARSYI